MKMLYDATGNVVGWSLEPLSAEERAQIMQGKWKTSEWNRLKRRIKAALCRRRESNR